jgi:putative phosphoesterase
VIIGVISDTHGLLRTEAVEVLRGSDHIIHAGDVGDSRIIDALRGNAPVTFIRGNIDTGPWGRSQAGTEVIEVAGKSFYVLHDLKTLDLDPRAAGFSCVVSGHSHQPRIEWKNDVLYFNPGSAGPRRFKLPISVGRIVIEAGRLRPEIVPLPVQGPH